MSPILIISLFYGFISLGMICILFFGFRGTIDMSGRFFLGAEVLSLLAVAMVTVLNLDPIYKQTLFYYIGNSAHFVSQMSIAFSVYALTHDVSIKRYLCAVAGVLGYWALAEYARSTLDYTAPLLLALTINILLGLCTYMLCLRVQNSELKSNPFFRFFGYLQIAWIGVNLLRLAACFFGIYIAPVHADALGLIVYLSIMLINIFSYMAYSALRMTWVPDADKSNFFNRRLALSINENNQLVRGLMRSNRMLGMSALAGSLAHQLSQPLTGARLETESIKRDLAHPDRQAEATASLDKVSRQLGKVSELVRNLRRLFGGATTQFQNFALVGICDEVLDLVSPTATANRIAIHKDYRANPTVHGDPIQIQQVLINLLNNAIEASMSNQYREPQITLRIARQNGFAVLAVEDNGTGIADDLLPSMFELYKTTKPAGMGIGLWLSQTIVNQHHGQITAANKMDGGAMLTIQLPIAKTEA